MPARISLNRLASEDGFSLVEALVALAVLASVASVALMVLASNAQRGDQATARLRATLAAEAILNRVGLDVALKQQSLSGRLVDGSRWEVLIAPYKEEGLAEDRFSPLLEVEVAVTPKRWPAQAVRLKTLRLLGVPL
jgi:general secretion pathway protein I